MEIEKIKIALAGVAAGAVTLFGLGFGTLGWLLGGTADENARNAVTARLTPICLEMFKNDPMNAQRLKEINDVSYGLRGEYVAKHGWATMPGEKSPDLAVAEACGDKIGS